MARTLVLKYDDTLRVIADDGAVKGEIAPSVDGWAVYRATVHGVIVTERIATSSTIQKACEALDIWWEANG
jgi:hypothetical protein